MTQPGLLPRTARLIGRAEFLPRGLRTRITRLLHSPVSGAAHEFETEIRGQRYAGNLGSYIDWVVYFLGSHEPHVIEALEILAKALPEGRKVAWDVGANSGQHALMMARHVDVVHAFEPWPAVRQQLARNVALNPGLNIVVHGYGLGDADDKRLFHGPDERNLGVGAFDGGFMGKGKSASFEIALRSGDSIVAEGLAPPPGLMKIDVEGYEPLVLKGLARTFAMHRPIIVLEYPEIAYRTTGSPLGLVPANYIHYAVSESVRGPRLLAIEPTEASTWDIVLVPEELKARVEALAFYPQRV